jgi:integrase
MIEPRQREDRTLDVVTLPDGRRFEMDLFGLTMVPNDTGDHMFDFSWVAQNSDCHRSAATLLRGLLFTHSVDYAAQCTRSLGALISEADTAHGGPISSLALSHLADWPIRHGTQTWRFLRAMFRKWIQAGLPGLDTELIAFVNEPEHFEEDGDWYFALVANDPERGAFTEQELKSIRDGLNKSFEEGNVSLEDWTLVWFLIATGVRPVQIARMTLGDVIVTTGPEGKEITLLIPLAKGQQQVGKGRWRRKSPSVLTEVLLRYLQLPRFASGDPGTPLFCEQSNEVAKRIRAVFGIVRTASERLGGNSIPIFPYRFRYTLGTRAIQLGASDHEAARLLTHRSTRCIHYYRASLPTLQKPIADAIGPEMVFIAKAFQGRLIGTLEEATRKGQPGAVIRDFAHLVGQKLGACGTNAACHQNAPRACLTCRKFEPLRTAPWEQFLDVLREDLDAEEEDRIRLITQEQIDVVLEIIAERDATPEATPWAA